MCGSFVFGNSSINFEGDNIMPQLQSQVLSISKSLLCPRKGNVLCQLSWVVSLTRPGPTKTQELGPPERFSGWEGHTEALLLQLVLPLAGIRTYFQSFSATRELRRHPVWELNNHQTPSLSTVWLARPQSLRSSRTNPL